MVHLGLRMQGNNAVRVALDLGLNRDSEGQAKIARLQTLTLENTCEDIEYIAALMAVTIIIMQADNTYNG